MPILLTCRSETEAFFFLSHDFLPRSITTYQLHSRGLTFVREIERVSGFSVPSYLSFLLDCLHYLSYFLFFSSLTRLHSLNYYFSHSAVVWAGRRDYVVSIVFMSCYRCCSSDLHFFLFSLGTLTFVPCISLGEMLADRSPQKVSQKSGSHI